MIKIVDPSIPCLKGYCDACGPTNSSETITFQFNNGGAGGTQITLCKEHQKELRNMLTSCLQFGGLENE